MSGKHAEGSASSASRAQQLNKSPSNRTPDVIASPGQPVWSIVRHYNVLLSSDMDKKDTNRVWHDGRLSHHTYNGRLILYDEGDVELANGFHSQQQSSALFAEGTEHVLDDFVVQILGFQRVTRTDLAPVLHAKEAAKARKQAEASINGSNQCGLVSSAAILQPKIGLGPQSPSANIFTGRDTSTTAQRTPLRSSNHLGSTIDTPKSSTTPSRRTASAQSPAFRTPFKRAQVDENDIDDKTASHVHRSFVDNRQQAGTLADRPMKKRLGSSRPRASGSDTARGQ
ncbi:unnamed protein product [Sympodiomycopsis kandeliae]